jgi:hypothetical protein
VTPRCGRVMQRREATWGALLDEVTCGRPEGHNAPCRSVQAVAAAVERERRTWPAKRERRLQARRRAVLAEALREFDGYVRAA